MLVEIIYYRSAEGWHVRSIKNKQVLAYGFDSKAEAEEFCAQQQYEVA